MSRKKKAEKVDIPRVTMSYGRCFVFSSEGMACPLCKTDVPPGVAHCCEKKDNRAATR